ncbi:phage SPO1 DNA polymerase-related protein [Chlorobaculum parvum NCIB 8327]|uniref:Type-4 uracil-DNA glycosylase n=1 Tax=Chlorobaculum parvum (strain DSM 263 / NCIMB 8327) TaxID=517417 RepID=B3QQL7_CHLP8|nr:uracil-DNA glycosylase [Chlorobaculum parvum]ACF12220.1 phage SPO1 DNA polymerase-related protein [Chlorobaculum parvum NCIB 8327]
MTQESLFDPVPEQPKQQAVPALDLGSLGKVVQECRKCRLAETRNSVVFGEGNPKARVFVIGEAPGADEDAQGRPFVGRSGQLLDKILLAIGFERSDVYIGNIIKCRPPQNRNPLGDEIECCKPWLMQQLEIIKPNIILLLGRVAANTILENTLSMSAMRGKLIRWNGFDCFVTYHPAALLRNPNWKRLCWEDVQLLRAHYDKVCPNS